MALAQIRALLPAHVGTFLSKTVVTTVLTWRLGSIVRRRHSGRAVLGTGGRARSARPPPAPALTLFFFQQFNTELLGL